MCVCTKSLSVCANHGCMIHIPRQRHHVGQERLKWGLGVERQVEVAEPLPDKME